VLRQLPRTAHRRVRWKNGLGWTTELAVEPTEGEFEWRVSIAEVDSDCDFSRFPGIDRSLLVLDGEGMAVHVEGQPAVRLVAEGEPLAFPGEVATRCELVGGPTRDFNVMTRRGVIEHALTFHRLRDRGSLAAGCRWVIYVVRGEIEIDAARVAAGDAVLVAIDATQADLDVSGEADLVLVRLWP
jgi:environmental stress-induced protein Ves